jgi:uncharacterized protein YxeA
MKKLLFVSAMILVLTLTALTTQSCKAWRTISTTSTYVQQDDSTKTTTTISTKTEVDKDVLKALYADKVEEAIREAHVPAYVGVTLTASSTKAADLGVVEGDEEIFVTTEKPTIRFTKPRAGKEA